MGLDDPQWGKNKGGSNPPDLDEVLRNVNKKLNSFFGQRKNNNKDDDPNPRNSEPRNHGGGSVLLIIALMVAVWLASGFYIVDEGHRGVVLRFGKYVDTTPAGLRWHLPYPVEKVELVNVSQVRTVEIGYRNNVKNKVLRESLMLTDDENIIDIQFAVQYILNDPEDFLFKNRSPEDAVLQAAETAGREQVAANATQLMQKILDRYQIGISINRVTMQNAQPPEQVQAAFDDAVKAGQDRERQKNEGQAYANDVIPRAVGSAARLTQESEYSKAPKVTRDRLYLDMMQQVLSTTSKIVVDQKNGNNLLYLPLDKLIGNTGSPLPAPVSVQSAPTQEITSDHNSRTRDSFRSRERESR